MSLLSKIAKSVASAHKELLRDVRNVITGFLKSNCMKLTTGNEDNVSRISRDTETETNRQTDRQTERQRDRQTRSYFGCFSFVIN